MGPHTIRENLPSDRLRWINLVWLSWEDKARTKRMGGDILLEIKQVFSLKRLLGVKVRRFPITDRAQGM
jgi:hypothetical protein